MEEWLMNVVMSLPAMDNPATKDYKNSPSNIQMAFFELVLGISSIEKRYVLEKKSELRNIL